MIKWFKELYAEQGIGIFIFIGLTILWFTLMLAFGFGG